MNKEEKQNTGKKRRKATSGPSLNVFLCLGASAYILLLLYCNCFGLYSMSWILVLQALMKRICV